MMMGACSQGLACRAWNLRIPMVKTTRERMKKGVLGKRMAVGVIACYCEFWFIFMYI
jgi:hypothetical protein